MPFPNAVLETNIAQLNNTYDAYVLISNTLSSQYYPHIQKNLEKHQSIDERVGVTPILFAADVAGQRLLQVPVGQLSRDYDDVRRIFDATRNVAQILLDSGIRKPLLEINLV
ncbi:MAG: leucyl aminopeptidase, partial [Glaciecola sp.]